LQSLVFGEESGPGQTLLSKQVIDEQMSVNRCNGKVGEIVKKVKDLKEKFNIWEKERTKDCTGASERSTNSEQHQLDRIASTQQRVSSFTSYLTAYKIQSVVMKGCNEELKGGIAKRTNGLHGVVHALEEKELMAKKLVENERVIEELKERVSKLEEQKPRNSSEQVRYPEQTKDDSVGEYLPGAEAVYRPQEVPPDPRDSGVGKEQTDNYPSGAGVAPQTASDQVTPQSSKSEPVDKTQGKELSKSVSSPDTCTAPQEETGASTMAGDTPSENSNQLKKE
jgi:polyhydroxyalkanoate synthesis regulator phasin